MPFKHISVPLANTMEFINTEEVSISPLITKCNVKVCYVGQQANRNGTVITKEVATELGKKLPGSPVVGYYNEESKDFEEHNRDIEVTKDGCKLIDTTKPYGFVPTDAKVWFQVFTDDNVEHEYLVTEAYLWTAAYPECQRVITEGNNQSMELHKKSVAGTWATDDNSQSRIFIINDGLIEKLCILGQDFEPCFEGAQIKESFSLDELKTTLFSMMQEITQVLSKGGHGQMDENNKMQDTQFANKEKEDEKKEPAQGGTEKQEDKKKDEDKDKKNYVLVSDYIELKRQYDELQAQYATVLKEKETLSADVESLREFKMNAEKKAKEEMINSFSMLSDKDKKDVVDNINTYSLDDIEAKLSVLCVRKKVNFSKTEDNTPEEKDSNPALTFNLSGMQTSSDPAWMKAVYEVQKGEM